MNAIENWGYFLLIFPSKQMCYIANRIKINSMMNERLHLCKSMEEHFIFFFRKKFYEIFWQPMCNAMSHFGWKFHLYFFNAIGAHAMYAIQNDTSPDIFKSCQVDTSIRSQSEIESPYKSFIAFYMAICDTAWFDFIEIRCRLYQIRNKLTTDFYLTAIIFWYTYHLVWQTHKQFYHIGQRNPIHTHTHAWFLWEKCELCTFSVYIAYENIIGNGIQREGIPIIWKHKLSI